MRSTRLLTALAFTTFATIVHPAYAAPGDLDVSFGAGGKVTVGIGSDDDLCQSMAVQADGKIVLAGWSRNGGGLNFALVRLNANGSLDTTFNGTGKVTTAISSRNVGSAVAIQSNGKIVIAGTCSNGINSDIAVVRYNVDGSLDTTFNATGKVTTDFGYTNEDGFGLAIQTDGKIVFVGTAVVGSDNSDIILARFLSSGTLDATFGTGGKVITAIGSRQDEGHSVAIQSDSKIVVTGYSHNGSNHDIALVRYNANGSLDTSINGSGKVTTDFGGTGEIGLGVAIHPDAKIVVAGFSGRDVALVRYNANGTLDTSMNGSGRVTTNFGGSYNWGNSIAVQSDGKIVVAGATQIGDLVDYRNFAVVRYNLNGSLDTTFSSDGKVITDFGGKEDEARGVAVQTDGKIVVAGYVSNGSNWDFAVARYEGGLDSDGDGILDQFETGTGIYVSPQDTGTSPTIADTDGDGLGDGEEVNTYHSNPNIFDTDGDGFGDGFEVSTGFSPTSAASTPDALSSILRAVEYRFNAAQGVSYRIEASTDLENWSTVETNIIGNGGVITRFYSIEGQARRYFRSRRN